MPKTNKNKNTPSKQTNKQRKAKEAKTVFIQPDISFRILLSNDVALGT